MAKKNKKKKNILRKNEEELKEQKINGKHKKEAPDRLPETPSQPEEKKHQWKKYQLPHNNKAAILLIFIGLASLIFIGYFLFTKLLRPQSLSELLPEEKTIAFAEFTFDQTQWNDVQEALKPYPQYDIEKLRTFFEQSSPLNFTNDIEPWLGRRAGVAFVATHPLSDGSPDASTIVFVESKDHQKTVAALAGNNATQYQNFPLYESAKVKYKFFTFVNNYAVIADQGALQEFLDSTTLPRLSSGEAYRKVANNVPTNGAVFMYADFKKWWPQFMSWNPYTEAKQLNPFMPFLELFSSGGMAVRMEKERIITQVYTAIDKEKIDGKGFIEYPTKYQGDLLALANEGTIFFTSGHDLVRELSRLETIFQSGTKASPFTFEGLLEAQKLRFFGKEIGLKDDIYPMLNGEYLVAMEGTLQKPVVNFFMKLGPENRDRFETLLTAFIKAGGIFSPEVKEVTLPDGTKGREVVAVGQIITRRDEPYGAHLLTTLQIGNEGMAAYLSVSDDTVIISTDQTSIKKIIDRIEGKESQNLTKDQFYSHNLQLVMKTADETMAFKPENFLNLLPQAELLKPYLQPFGSVMVGKNFFEDGISEIYLITLK